MPSGVSHGSALPAGALGATASKATSAKFGMRVIPLFPQTCDSVRSVFADSSCRRDRRNRFYAEHWAGVPRCVPLETREPHSIRLYRVQTRVEFLPGTETWLILPHSKSAIST